jgi:caffeoyl-CoA O-methyltransferase
MVLPDEIERYAAEHTTPEPAHLAAVAEATRAATDAPGMMVGPVEGRFLEFLVRLSGARRVLEIGTFTGYSALSMAAALPPDGRLVTCEIDPERAALARRHFEASPFGHLIDLREGPALDTLATLDGPFDLVFIDADKTGYRDYYEAALARLSPTGLVAVDNVLWSGRVLDPAADDDDTRAIRAFNDHVRSDSRVHCVLLTVRDGILLVRRAP